MGRNSHYFKNREERSAHAMQVKEENERRFADAIQYSIEKADICLYQIPPENLLPRVKFWGHPHTNFATMYLVPMDTVSALFEMQHILQNGEGDRCPCILNFASYTHPGGMFMEGSSAQEESLCHESTLYNVLSNDRFMKKFYLPHANKNNDYLYADEAIITPNIVFHREIDGKSKIEYADVITCAAPNAHAARQYKNVDEKRINESLVRRIYTVLYQTLINANDVLILGAFGCGVFENNPYDVAWIFKKLIMECFGTYFSAIIFAVPKDGESAANYQAFDEVINNPDYNGEKSLMVVDLPSNQ